MSEEVGMLILSEHMISVNPSTVLKINAARTGTMSKYRNQGIMRCVDFLVGI